MDAKQWLEQPGLRRGFDEVAVGLAVHDASGRLVYLNRAAYDLLGWQGGVDVPLADFVARLSIERPSGEPVPPADLPVALVLAGRDQVDTELSVRMPSGIRRPLRVIARKLQGPGETPSVLGALATLLDYGEAEDARGAVRDLVEQSTPVLNVGNKLLLQPLIGTLDSQRAALAMEKLLETIGKTGSKVAIVDITGVSAVDTATANHLLRSLAAARLLGCEVVLSGVSPPIARTITLLGLDLSALRTKRDVAAAIEFGRRWVEAADAVPTATQPGQPPQGAAPAPTGTLSAAEKSP